MYIRVTRTVQDRGVLVRENEVEKTITDREVDWYKSSFLFGEDAKDYWEANGESIKGYTGEVFTRTLYWDLDAEGDFGKAKKAALALCSHLDKLGLSDGIEMYFSGNKGFHVFLQTDQKFTPTETSAMCYNMAMEAGVPQDVFDTSVYNITRIFRIVNTRHQKSKLYKIPVDIDELSKYSEADVRKMAAEPRFEEFDSVPVSAKDLLKKYAKKISNAKKVQKNNVTQLHPDKGGQVSNDVDFSMCPPGHRRCVYALEQGHYGPSERHTALIRLAAYYRGQGFSRKHAGDLIYKSLENRKVVFPDCNDPDITECERDIDQIYSDDWKGGTFTCKTDIYLQSKCDCGNGPCYSDAKVKIRQVKTIKQLLNTYVQYGEEALADYPKFGINWIDERVRLRPKNFSVVAGANGGGKTSLAIQLLDNLNKQKMFHVIFSLDMADSSLLEKLGARYTKYSQNQIEKAFNINSLDQEIKDEVMEVLSEKLPYTLFDFTSSATMNYIEQTLMGLKQVYENLQLAVIDYAGRILGEFDNQFANSTHNAMMANDVAKRTNTHMLFLSQVSRENGDHTSPLRSSRVSKDSGSWEENATMVMTMWRPFGSGLHGADAYVHAYIAKNRSGSLGENVFNWEGKTGIISEMQTEREFEYYRNLCQQQEIDEPKFNWFMQDDDNYDPRLSSDRSEERLKYEGEEEEDDEEELQDPEPKGFKLPKRGPRRA